MTDIALIEQRLSLLREWITRAAEALMTYFREENGVFWRDSLAPAEEQGEIVKQEVISKQAGTAQAVSSKPKYSPTSTARSFFALFEYVRFLNEEDLEPKHETYLRALQGVCNKYFAHLDEHFDELTTSATNSTNPFTNSHILIGLCCYEPLERIFGTKISPTHLDQTRQKLAKSILQRLEEKGSGASPSPTDEIHDFLTLHAIRALEACSINGKQLVPIDLERRIQERVKAQVLALLSYNFAGVNSKFDAAELTFSVELLNRFRTEDTDQLTDRALLSIAEAQKDGSWSSGRMVSYQKKTIFHIASFEIALTLANILLRRITYGEADSTTCDVLMKTLDSSFELVQSSYDKSETFKGWSNDHARTKGLFESWTTAIVLTFLIHYYDANVRIRQIAITRRYRTKLFPAEKKLSFPDMEPIFRHPDWIDSLKAFTDPTDGEGLSHALDDRLLKPIKNDFVQRPREVASLILYGSPGTGKTSLVKSIAAALHWPFVTLSPPDFLRHGLEGFESTAATIFDDLLHLRRVVVLFDECEDFFRKRPSTPAVESRTAGAFITSGMLPRLQDLRDKTWIVFVLATNSTLKELDAAVIRPGRFDYAYEVPFPSHDALLRFAKSQLGKIVGDKTGDIPKYLGLIDKTLRNKTSESLLSIDTLKSILNRDEAAPPISFGVLKSFIHEVFRAGVDSKPSELVVTLDKLRKGPQSLI
jgi:hypothetical protein